MNKLVSKAKEILAPVIEFYKTLPLWGKVIFIIVLVLAKLGPDFLLFPLIYKYINRKMASTNVEVVEESLSEN